MAAITTQALAQDGAFALTFATLSASDTITFSQNSYILFYNSTAGSLTGAATLKAAVLQG